MIKKILTFLMLAITVGLIAENDGTDANVFGDVQSHGEHVPFVSIIIDGTTIGTTTDVTGHYMLIDLPVGKHTLKAKALGYKDAIKEIEVIAGESQEINFVLEEEVMQLDGVVVTGTKTFKRKTDSPVIVGVLEAKMLDNVQACNISEGLKFQPGLRVETDCQTCNYTQLRMNGLQGGYSQILINGRPIFSPLTGLYGMEQIPTNMVDRIEVVRGGGSALYGSGAIGGTVNIITRIPKESAYDFQLNQQLIAGEASDNMINGNINMLTHKHNAGASVFISRRVREMYDQNGDNFSELPELRNNSFGANAFYQPTANQKLEMNFSSMYEYRYGGEMVDKPAYLTQQSEERTHHVLMGGLDYQINFNDENSSFIAYFAGQNTDRDHYTGIIPDKKSANNDALYNAHINHPPYGYTENLTLQGGTQINHRVEDFFGGSNVLTFGMEYVYDDVFDTIPSYGYEIDQTTENFGLFAQSDWTVAEGMTVLAGLRADKHNLVDRMIVSPRVSFLYKYKTSTQFRLTWGTGFRAPQAFDSDMHIAFAGGGISRTLLADNLHEERSNSFSGSVNFDKPTENWVAGFTLEGFYTKLFDAFVLEELGEDALGTIYEKRNSSGSTVQGGTLELRANYRRKIQLESGYTLQTSMYDEAVSYSDDLATKREYLRTPNQYGYFTLTATSNEKINATLNAIYTGKMDLLHAAAANDGSDVYVTTPNFWEFGVKAGYTFALQTVDSKLEVFGGVKNLFNAYQDDFDMGKERDSGYIYGPAQPRTVYVGLRIRSL